MKVQMKMEIKFYIDVTQEDLEQILKDEGIEGVEREMAPLPTLCLWAANEKVQKCFPKTTETIEVQETEVTSWTAYGEDGEVLE